MPSNPPYLPLVTIVGATGTGKSQLAVELATQFNGEIINGDAMQMYDGLPIITNKIPPDERKGISHHLLGCVGPEETPWQVGVFTQRALSVIQAIRSRGRLPILVGGTHYYTQSLLFEDSLVSSELQDEHNADEGRQLSETTSRFSVLDGPTGPMLERLREVDPVMADRWHPNDRRKIRRSLEIFLSTGRKASEIYEEQRGLRHGSTRSTASHQDRDGGDADMDGSDILAHASGKRAPMRFPTLILWIHADQNTLKSRLDARVDTMVRDGLLSEVEQLDSYLQDETAKAHVVDRTRGIWVAIGYKQFKPYLAMVTKGNGSERDLELRKVEAIDQTKAATRQYAKRQTRWIRIKLWNAVMKSEQSRNMFLLDGSILENWSQDVKRLAAELLEAFLNGLPLPEPFGLSSAAERMFGGNGPDDLGDRRDLWVRKTCKVCDVTAVTEKDWVQHVQGRTHRRATKSSSTSRRPDGPS